MRRAPPSLAATAIGAMLWAAAMAASALANLLLYQWETPAKIWTVTLLFGLGGLAAFPAALFFARLATGRRGGETAFSAAFVALIVFTIVITSACFSLQHRLYNAESHSLSFSPIWVLEFALTIVGALAQFVLLGTRLYFPIGFIALFIAGLWFARLPR
ncbi:MAG TPA: hypothetical protein VGM46_00130 [Mesorhizobium sp.]